MEGIKVCIDPHCEAVAHNCDKKETGCRDCGMILVAIDLATYQKKFASNFFQYDYRTGQLTNASEMGYGLQLALNL
jgi:hypothetical protein